MALTLEQRIARKSGIGGSDVAAVLGIPNPAKKTPLDIYYDKISDEELVEEAVNEYQHWGNLLEGVIREEYIKETGKQIIVPPMRRHPEYTWMIANVDGFDAQDNAVLEIKNVHLSQAKFWGEEESDNIPESYLYQCAHYSIVFNAPRVHVRALIGGSNLRKYTYEKNERLEKAIIDKTKYFWHENVLAQVPPPFQTYADLLSVYPKSQPGLFITATLELEGAVNRFREINKFSKGFEEEKEALRKLIGEHMGNCERLVDTDGKELLSWKSQSTGRFDTTKFKEQYPDLYKQFTRSSDSRVFRLRGE